MNSLVGARKRRRRRLRRRVVVVSVSASSLLLLLLLLPALRVPPVADASVRVLSGVAGNAMPDRSVVLDAENCEQQRGSSDAENASNCDDDGGDDGGIGSDRDQTDDDDAAVTLPPAKASFESLPATGLGRTFEDGVRYGANLFLPPLRITGARRKGGGRKYRVGGRDDGGEKGADENVEEDYDPYFCREEEDEDDSERGWGCEEDDGDEDDENRNVPERRRKRRILRTHSTGGGGESSSGTREKYYEFGGGRTEAEGATTTSGHRSNDDDVTNRDDDDVLPRTTLPVALLVKRGGCTFESKARRAARLNDELMERQKRQLTDNINDNDDGTTGRGNSRGNIPGTMPTPRVRYLVVYNNETETADESDDDDDDDGLVVMGRERRHRIDDDGESATDLDDIGMQFVSRATGTDLLRRMRERSEELWPVKFAERQGHHSGDSGGASVGADDATDEVHANRDSPFFEKIAASAAAATTAMHFAQHSEWYFPILLDSEVRPPERRIGSIGGAGTGNSGSATAGSSGDDEGTTRPSNATTDQRQQQHATTTTTFIPWLWITSQVLLCSLFLYLFVNAAFVWYELGGRIRLERRRRRGADDRWYVPPVTLRIVRARGRIFWATPQSMLHVAAARRERRKRRMTLTEQQVLDLPEAVFGPDMRRMRFDIVETADEEEEEEETGGNGGTRRRRRRSPPLAIVSDGDDGADANAGNDGNDGFDDGRAASDRGNGGEDARAETGTAVPANEEEEAPSQVHNDDDGGSGGDRRRVRDGRGAEGRDDERRQLPQQQQLWACQRSCSVCLEDFADGEVVRVLVPCSHVFHTDCILPWLTKKRGTCPLCQQYVWRRRRDADGNPVNASDLALPPTRRTGGGGGGGVGGERGAGASDEEAAGDGGDDDEDEDEDEGSAAAPAVVTAAEFAPEEEEEDEWEATLTSLSYDDDDEVDDDDDDDEENERSQRRAQDARPLPHMPPTM